MRLATICARSGSKGVPKKNLLNFNGKSLLEITVAQAKMSKMFDYIAVSTDDPKLLEDAKSLHLDLIFKREEKFSGDLVSKPETVRNLTEKVEEVMGARINTIVDLDITAPLRNKGDIESAINLLEINKLHSVLSGGPSRRNPFFNIVIKNEENFIRIVNESQGFITSRQNSPQCYDLNGSINVWNRDNLFHNPSTFQEKTMLFEMKVDQIFDIDTNFDVELMEFLLNRKIGIDRNE
jgi:CMP-N,N'-diacetyllegionaminic acid synthase